MTIIRKSELADELGVRACTVSAYVRHGLPVRSDGRLDRDRALNWIASSVQAQSGGRNQSGAAAAAALSRNRDDPDSEAALAAVESVLGPVANAVLQECRKAGEAVVAMVEGVDPEEARVIAEREARKLLARLARMPIEAGNGRG